jgi:hypothetical protein
MVYPQLGNFWFNGEGRTGPGLSSVHLLFCEEVGDHYGGVMRGSGNEQFFGKLSGEYMVQSHKSQKVLLFPKSSIHKSSSGRSSTYG